MAETQEFITIKLPKHIICLTSQELQSLLLKNLNLYRTAIWRGKMLKRQQRIEEWENQGMKNCRSP